MHKEKLALGSKTVPVTCKQRSDRGMTHKRVHLEEDDSKAEAGPPKKRTVE